MDNNIIWNKKAQEYFGKVRTVTEVEAAGEWPEQQPVNPEGADWFGCPSCDTVCHKDDRLCPKCRRMLK